MILSKIARLYSSKILEKVRGLRGFTRFFVELKKLALKYDVEEVKDGFKYNFNGQDLLMSSREDFYSIFEEPVFIDKFQEEIEGGSIICDVGAYHGIYSVIGLKGQEVHAFEVSPRNARKLKENVDIQGGDNIIVNEKAVWNKETQVQTGGIQGGSNQIGNRGQVTNTITLDSYFQDEDKPDIVKIDVEGAELQVIEGFEQVLKEEKPKLFIEAHQDERTQEFDYCREDFLEKLKDLNYEITHKIKRGKQLLIVAR